MTTVRETHLTCTKSVIIDVMSSSVSCEGMAAVAITDLLAILGRFLPLNSGSPVLPCSMKEH